MDDIERFLDLLNKMVPIGLPYRVKLKSVLSYKTFKNRRVLFRKGKVTTKAYQLLSGYLVGINVDENGEESIEFINFPGDIVTDMFSFFQGNLIRFSIRCVGEVRALEFKKRDFEQFNIYPETNKIVQHIMMAKEQIAYQCRILLKIKPVSLRVQKFVTSHPVLDLPSRYGASYLDITESEYIEYSQPHFKHLVFDNDAATKRILFQHPRVVAHDIRTYLLENYTNPDIENTGKIAAKYNVTRKTLTNAFKNLFGMTIYQMILDLRMQKAMYLLKEKNMEVNKVALMVGYKDVSTFSRVFKHSFGNPPSQFDVL